MQPTRPEGEPSPGNGRWRSGRPQPRSTSRSGAERIVFSADEPKVESSPRKAHDLVVTSSPSSQPGGHIPHCRSLRRSEPSPYEHWGDCNSALPRTPSQDVRVRRIRRPADFGAGLCGSSSSRSRSTAVTDANDDLVSELRPARCGSMPPTGTAKADASNVSAAAKARAIASLQRLFFEEMAKGGGDANSAAAMALRRLSEGGSSSNLATGMAEDAGCMLGAPAPGFSGCSPTSSTASPVVSPFVPRRPDSMMGAEHRRRPAPMRRVPVQVQS